MVAGYSTSRGVFQAEKPHVSSTVTVPLPSPGRNSIDLSPDGKRFAIVKASSETQAPVKLDKITLFINFVDELHNIAPAAKK